MEGRSLGTDVVQNIVDDTSSGLIGYISLPVARIVELELY